MISKDIFESIENTLQLEENIRAEAEDYTLKVLDFLKQQGVNFNETTSLGLVSHLLTLVRRINLNEKVADLGDEILSQIDPKAVEHARNALNIIEKDKNIELDNSEIALVAIHVQNAMQQAEDNNESKEEKMGRPIIVIGDRMGKGQHVADGVVKAGGEAYTIPGMAADMKLGDVMKEKNADLGISFCGSGGAGALSAQNKYGYTCRYGMRSIEEGEKAVADGVIALGFGFMDKEELGERIVKAWLKKNG